MGRSTRINAALVGSHLDECFVLNKWGSLAILGAPRSPESWLAFGHTKNQGNAVSAGTLLNSHNYLTKGGALLGAVPWVGNCQAFACASASAIANVPGINTIELFSFGNAYTGHVFLVIDRDPLSAPAQPNNWGATALVVDMWHAIQQNSMVNCAYKPNSPYRNWLNGQAQCNAKLQVQ